jgi:hypothetical protein
MGDTVLRKNGFLKDYPAAVKKCLTAAGVGWKGALAKYPPQANAPRRTTPKAYSIKTHRPTQYRYVGYKRTGTLARKAGYVLQSESKSVMLRGVFYTPYVVRPREKPESMRGRVMWPGKEDEAKAAAAEGFRATFKRLSEERS